MKEIKAHFEVFKENGDAPLIFGICVPGGVRFHRLSSDYSEVNRLVELCNRNGLSPDHLGDVVEDFRRS